MVERLVVENIAGDKETMFIFKQCSSEEAGIAFKEMFKRLNENKIKADDMEERKIDDENISN
jgi:hypothetical protein